MHSDSKTIYEGARILITGGSGSVGLELARALLDLRPKEVRLFSNDENGLFEARTTFSESSNVSYRLGDVRDPQAIEGAVNDCGVVFHAAALKHVNLCEENPYEAISTNITGTQNVLNCVENSKVGKFVYISTDKAVNPISVMGATKLLAEKLTLNSSRRNTRTDYCCVRFGNVLGSRGSVIRIFEEQVRKGENVTVTDPNMTRFIMLPSDASGLVLRACEVSRSGETYVLDMPAVKIGDLAAAAVEYFAGRYGRDPNTVKVVSIGSRIGEKMHEDLMTEAEVARSIQRDEFHVIPFQGAEPSPHGRPLKRGLNGYSSSLVPFLSREQILALLARLYGYQGTSRAML